MENDKQEPFIFRPEFLEGVGTAIRRAVEESDAAGLRPAYEPAFSQLRTLEGMAKRSLEEKLDVHRQMSAVFSKTRSWEELRAQSQDEKLKAHQEAVTEKESRERRTRELQAQDLEFHRMALDLLQQPGQPGAWIKRQALEALQQWRDQELCQPDDIEAWRRWFDLPIEDAKEEILREGGTRIRWRSPLAFIFLEGPQQQEFWL